MKNTNPERADLRERVRSCAIRYVSEWHGARRSRTYAAILICQVGRLSTTGNAPMNLFGRALERAREQQAEAWAEDVVNISDDELPTHEAIGRARLRMQSRQWLAGKL